MTEGLGEEIATAMGAIPRHRGELSGAQRALDELTGACDLPSMPLWVIPSRELNAAAIGATPYDAVIAVTHGLVDALDPIEVRAVLAHEVGHILHGDAMVRTRMAVRAANQEDVLLGVHLSAWALAGFTESLFDDYLSLALIAIRRAHRSRKASKLAAWSQEHELAADRYAMSIGLGAWLRTGLRKIDGAPSPPEEDRLPAWTTIMQLHRQAMETHPPTMVRLDALANAGVPPRRRACQSCLAAVDERSTRCDGCQADLALSSCVPCGQPLAGGVRWCPSCGAPAAGTCPRCGAADRGHPYCVSCAGPLP